MHPKLEAVDKGAREDGTTATEQGFIWVVL